MLLAVKKNAEETYNPLSNLNRPKLSDVMAPPCVSYDIIKHSKKARSATRAFREDFPAALRYSRQTERWRHISVQGHGLYVNERKSQLTKLHFRQNKAF